jgi:hypothetical protein
MTREEFIRQYCARSGITWNLLRLRRIAVPCVCGRRTCQGWAMLPKASDATAIARATGQSLAAVQHFLASEPEGEEEPDV